MNCKHLMSHFSKMSSIVGQRNVPGMVVDKRKSSFLSKLLVCIDQVFQLFFRFRNLLLLRFLKFAHAERQHHIDHRAGEPEAHRFPVGFNIRQCVPASLDNVKKLVLPEGLTYIGSYTFNTMINLTEVYIPASVTEIHPTAGVVAIGARIPLIAYNINLGTDNLEIASKIAKIIREAGGGLKCVKAMGVMLEERNIAQVSINMTDFTVTPLHRVTELVRNEAARYGVPVIGTELIGLAPMQALFDAAEYSLQIEDFDPTVQVIENHLL